MARVLLGSVTAADCEWSYFRAGGKGGQHQNKASTGARCVHPPSGAVGESRTHRSQLENRRAAWRKMAESPEFTRWVHQQAGEALAAEGAGPRSSTDFSITDTNTLVEVRRDGRWVPESEAGP